MAATPPDKLLDALAELGHPPRTAIDEQRRFPRHIVRCDAEMYQMDRRCVSNQTVEIKLRDIGLGGMSCISPQWIEPDTLWRLTFLIRHYPVAEQGLVIRHCRQIADGLYFAGAQFIADAGLLAVLGVDPDKLIDHESVSDPDQFIGPADAA